MEQRVEFNEELIQRYDVAGPRYTSYPTAVQFMEGFDAEAYRRHVAASNSELIPKPLSLYVHLPWCVRKCPYCDFNSHAGQPDEEAYVEALIADLAADTGDVSNRPVGSIFFGGGTPSLFSSAAISRILVAVREQLQLADDVEITLEANPGTADAGHFAGYRAAGVNRLSIGVQSFDDTMLQRLGRIHTASEAREAFQIARAAGFDNINLDLMYGLPGQAPGMAIDDLRQAIALRPEHLSWYQLTLEPNTAFHATPPPAIPDDDMLGEIAETGIPLLASEGYAQYEVSAYARHDRRCRHNLNYWQFGDYIGIGAGDEDAARARLLLGHG